MGDDDRRSRIRLAAFDLDGTLLGPDLTLPRSVRLALGALRARGVICIIVTGRMHVTAEKYALELGLEGLPLVSYNGAMVKPVGGDEPWWYRPIDTELAVEIVSFLGERGLEPLVFEDDRVYAARPGPGADHYRLISGVDPGFVGDLEAFIRTRSGGTVRPAGTAPPAGPAPPLGPVRPTKLLQVESAELMPDLLGAALARFGGRANITTSYSFFLEFMDRSVSKGRALAEVCRRLGIEPEAVAAFGDGLNDLDMLRWAGLGVAMGHGPAELRQAAAAVAEGPPGEGVARFVEEHLL